MIAGNLKNITCVKNKWTDRRTFCKYNNILDSFILEVVLYMERKGVFTSFFVFSHGICVHVCICDHLIAILR